MSGHLLEAREVVKRFGARGRSVLALDHVSVAVDPSERVGIVGESGSGKSTLARVLVAIERPDEGELRFEGERLDQGDKGRMRTFRQRVQIVFQDPFGSLDPRMAIGESIAEPLRALGIGGDHRAEVRALLESVGLPAEAARLYPHQFSGGQRQRIAIARALAPRPQVLVADEAVSALDVSVRAQVLNLLASLVERYSLSLVFISHDMAVIRHLCTRVVVLYRGRIVEEGPAAEVFGAPQHPYTKALLAAVPRLP